MCCGTDRVRKGGGKTGHIFGVSPVFGVSGVW